MEANGKNIKKEGFFRAFIKSIKDFDKYEDFALESIGKTTVYLLKLIAIFTVVISSLTTYRFSKALNKITAYYDDNISQLSYEDGVLEINNNQKVEATVDDIYQNVIIDTSELTNEQIEKAISFTKENFSGLIIAGKMHGAGSDEPVADLEIAKRFVKAGADVILVPAVGTVPGFDMDDLKAVCKEVHSCGGLVLSAIGTSQEGSDTDTIKDIAIMNKICGVDIQHIGDAGYGGVAPVENIMAISKAVRGVRHTVSMMARSINR